MKYIFKVMFVFGIGYISDIVIPILLDYSIITSSNNEEYNEFMMNVLWYAYVNLFFLLLVNMTCLLIINCFFLYHYKKIFSIKLLIVEALFYFVIHLIYNIFQPSFIVTSFLCGCVLLILLFIILHKEITKKERV